MITISKFLSPAGVACSLLLAVSSTQAQVEVAEGPGNEFSYVYNPLEAEAFPADVLDTGDTQLAYVLEEGENPTALLYSVAGGESSVTWHFQLTEPGAVWSGDVRVKADVLMIADALADRWSNYWLLEYSTDGVDFAPFLSTYEGDAGTPYFWPGGAHSGVGPFFLDRGGYEGGSADLFIRVKAYNITAPDGNQMQAFRTDTDNNRQFEFIGTIVGEGEADAVTVSTQEAVALDQSADDDLKGLVGELSAPLHFTSAGGAEGFTNATSATANSGNVFWHPDNASYHITWDLGSETAASTRQLDELSVWVDAHDNGRRGYRGVFYTSTDNVEFHQVPGTAYGDSLVQGGSGGSPLFNNIRYTFDEGSVVGFRYLRFVSHGKETFEAYLAQTRFSEIDAWFSTVDQAPGFASWRAEHFPDELEDDAVSGPSADADGDGVTNLFEYALGLDPREASREGLPMVGIENLAADDYLVLSFRRPNSITDIGYTVEVSADLINWAEDAVAAGMVDHGDGTTTYTYRDSQAISQDDRRFMRLQVIQAE